jgi:hypothetical protein
MHGSPDLYHTTACNFFGIVRRDFGAGAIGAQIESFIQSKVFWDCYLRAVARRARPRGYTPHLQRMTAGLARHAELATVPGCPIRA